MSTDGILHRFHAADDSGFPRHGFRYLYDGFSGYTMMLPNFIKDTGKLKLSIDSKYKPVDRYYRGVIKTLTEAES